MSNVVSLCGSSRCGSCATIEKLDNKKYLVKNDKGEECTLTKTELKNLCLYANSKQFI